MCLVNLAETEPERVVMVKLDKEATEARDAYLREEEVGVASSDEEVIPAAALSGPVVSVNRVVLVPLFSCLRPRQRPRWRRRTP